MENFNYDETLNEIIEIIAKDLEEKEKPVTGDWYEIDIEGRKYCAAACVKNEEDFDKLEEDLKLMKAISLLTLRQVHHLEISMWDPDKYVVTICAVFC